MPDLLRVLIVEDQWMLADAFRLVLEAEADIELLPVASDGIQAVDSCAQTQPDVVLLDIDIPGVDGISLAGEIGLASPGAQVVMMSALPDQDLLQRAEDAGARGVLSKERAAGDLAGLLRRAAVDRP